MNIVFWGAQEYRHVSVCTEVIATMIGILYPDLRIATDTEKRQQAKLVRLWIARGSKAYDRRMFGKADLVVVCLPQDARCVARFMREYPVVLHKTFFLLYGLKGEGTIGVRELAHTYRILPDNCGVFEATADFYMAAKQGRSRAFVEKEFKNPGSLRNEQLTEQLMWMTERMLRQLETNSEQINS